MKHNPHKTINLDVLLRIITLFGFSAFFFMIVITKTVVFYVHPRNIPYIILGGLVMAIVALFLLKELFTPPKKEKPAFLTFFIVPLLLAFLLPARPFDTTLGGYTKLNLLSRANANAFQPFTNYDRERIEAFSPLDQSESELLHINRPYLEMVDGVIDMNNNNFARWLMEIYENPELYDGTPITLTGFLFQDRSMQQDAFVTSRMMMVCCVADLEMIGLLGQYPNEIKFPSDTWVRTSGTLSKSIYNGVSIPMIKVDTVEEVVRPKNEYVYPF
jgi:putative membrane protein